MKIKNISFVLIILLFGLVGRVYALEKVEVPSDSEEVSQAAKHENPKTQLSVKSNQGIDVIDVSLNSQQDATAKHSYFYTIIYNTWQFANALLALVFVLGLMQWIDLTIAIKLTLSILLFDAVCYGLLTVLS